MAKRHQNSKRPMPNRGPERIRIGVVDFFRAVESVQVVGVLLDEDPGDVGMPLETVTVHQGEDPLHLALVVDVLGENVLVERVAGGAVDVELPVFFEIAGALGQKLPALLAGGAALRRRF